MSSIRPVILCGGSGTRLWPDSREKFPKQFIPIINQKSLFDLTLDRIKKFKNSLKPLIITNEKYRFLVKDALSNQKVDATILLEPKGKNTGPAIYLAAKLLNNNDNLIFLPSDHYIGKDDILINSINKILESRDLVNSNWITFGITPTFPSTSYGYIKLYDKNFTNNKLFKVQKFVEKPKLNDAIKYCDSREYFWNSGIFIGNAKMIINSIRKHSPLISKNCDNLVKDELSLGKQSEYIFDVKKFNKIPSISIDVSVLQNSKNIYCNPIKCAWNDIGSWDRYFDTFSPKNNKNIIQIKSKNNSIKSSKRLITTIGVRDLNIVDNDDAILIAKKGLDEDMRLLISALDKKNKIELKENIFENRPWGKFEILYTSKNVKIKKITVNPQSRLSKQLHYYRSEHWLIIQGSALVYKNGKIKNYKKGESVDIPKESVHYIENNTNKFLKFIELQMGTYFGEDDIIRLDDIYGR